MHYEQSVGKEYLRPIFTVSIVGLEYLVAGMSGFVLGFRARHFDSPTLGANSIRSIESNRKANRRAAEAVIGSCTGIPPRVSHTRKG